jgi:subtilisin family serine protease
MKMMPKIFRLACAFALFTILIAPPFSVRGDDNMDDFRPGELLVTLRPGANINQFNARNGTSTLEVLTGTNSYRLGIPSGETVEGKLGQIASDPDLLSAQPNFEHRSPEVRQGSMAFLDQGSMAFLDGQSPANFYGQAPALRVRVNEAHALSRGAGVKVAVIDTGIDFYHPLLSGRITGPYYDFAANDSNPTDELTGPGGGHGTFVAGLIALSAPDARVMPLRAFGGDGRGTSFNIAKAIRHAANNGAHVINMSFGLLDEDELIEDAMEYARTRNVFMVASAGNANLEQVNYPAASDLAMAVTSTNAWNDAKAPFANYGISVDVAAPGVSVYSAFPGNRWAWWDGTSFSTALVSGEAALLLAPNLALDRNVLRAKIAGYGVPLDPINSNYAEKLGSVRVDFRAALEALSLLEATGVYDNKNGKAYQPGSPDGDEPKRDLNTTAEEFKCEIESGSNFWWQADYADPTSNAPNPSSVFVNINYRSEAGWAGTFTVQYYNGTTLLASANLPVNSSQDPGTGKGQLATVNWNLSGIVATRAAVAGGKVRFINQSYNGKKVWVTFSNLDAR